MLTDTTENISNSQEVENAEEVEEYFPSFVVFSRLYRTANTKT